MLLNHHRLHLKNGKRPTHLHTQQDASSVVMPAKTASNASAAGSTKRGIPSGSAPEDATSGLVSAVTVFVGMATRSSMVARRYSLVPLACGSPATNANGTTAALGATESFAPIAIVTGSMSRVSFGAPIATTTTSLMF